MKSGWWKLQFNVTVDGIEVDFDELPTAVKKKVLNQVAQGAVAGAFDTDIEPATGDQEGICPVCGGELEFGDNEQMDNGGVYPWTCKACGATGKQGYDEVFDGRHYDVRDANGGKIPGRAD